MLAKTESPSRASGAARPGTSNTGLFAANVSPGVSPRRSMGPGHGQEARDARRHNSITLYDQVESRAGPLKIYTLPRTHKPIKTQTVSYFDEEAEKQLRAHYERKRAEILKAI